MTRIHLKYWEDPGQIRFDREHSLLEAFLWKFIGYSFWVLIVSTADLLY